MITTTHAWSTWRLARGGPHTPWVVLGGVLPDLPAWAIGAVVRARGVRGPQLIVRVYRRPGPARVHRGAHSLLAAAVLLSVCPRGGRGRALATGWCGHVLADVLTHHDDAWPALWPVSSAVWRSPVSYWQREHHARSVQAAQAAVLIVDGMGRPGRQRWAAGGALLGALAAQVQWPPRDRRPTPARGRRRERRIDP